MTILTYQIFKTVTEMGSFQKAAGVLGLTPSAISHAIAAMEKELGFTVLTRSKTGVTLTNFGEQILPYVNGVLNSEESLQQTIAEIGGLKTGRVRIGCFSSACAAWVPSIIHGFAKEYPAVHIEVYQGTYDDVRFFIKNGIVDFGFLSASSAKDLPIDIFYRDPLLCVTSRDFDKDSSEKMTTAEMAKHYFVAQRESTDADIQRFLKENDLEMQAAYHVVDDLAGISMVAGGLGICILPELVVRSMPFAVKTYEIEPEAHRLIGLSALNPRYMAPAVRTLYSYVLDTYRNTEGEALGRSLFV